MADNVNHPAHYEAGPFECVELTRLYPFMGGNAIKYVYRHRLKGREVEDLRKALWYLDHAEPDELHPSYTRRNVQAFGAATPLLMSSMEVAPGCEAEAADMMAGALLDLAFPDNGATRLLRVLEGHVGAGPRPRLGADPRQTRRGTPHRTARIGLFGRRAASARRLERVSGRHVEAEGKGHGAVRRRTSCRTTRLRYEPIRPVGDGWSFRLRVERLASDGEWEPVLARDYRVRTSDVMGNPGGLVSFEERTAREAGYRRADLPIVDSPVFA